MSTTATSLFGVTASYSQTYYQQGAASSWYHSTWGVRTSGTPPIFSNRASAMPKPVRIFEFEYRKPGERKTVYHLVWATNEEEALRNAPDEILDGFMIVGFIGGDRRND